SFSATTEPAWPIAAHMVSGSSSSMPTTWTGPRRDSTSVSHDRTYSALVPAVAEKKNPAPVTSASTSSTVIRDTAPVTSTSPNPNSFPPHDGGSGRLLARTTTRYEPLLRKD